MLNLSHLQRDACAFTQHTQTALQNIEDFLNRTEMLQTNLNRAQDVTPLWMINL